MTFSAFPQKIVLNDARMRLYNLCLAVGFLSSLSACHGEDSTDENSGNGTGGELSNGSGGDVGTGGLGTGGLGTGGGVGTGGVSTGGLGSGGAETGGTGTGGGGSGGLGTGGDGTGGASGGGCDPAMSGTARVCIKGKRYYLNGINVAWDQWDADLTNYNAANFETMFATLAASGGNSVRWWWFPTADQQLSYNGNLVQPLSQTIFDNLDVAFDAAANHGILIMPVLLSFDIEGGRESLVTDEAATDAFVTNVVSPLVQRYNDHPGLGLWEIMNEGDWLLTDEEGTVSQADYVRFHAKVAAGIHAADPDALVTTGSASFKYLASGNNILSDAALQAAAGGDPLARLDVYQTHYYPWMHGNDWSYEPWIQTAAQWQNEGKPVLIGEFPCLGEEGRWTTMQMHVESVNQGYAGTFCWAYFDNRADMEGTWSDAQPAVQAIAAQIPGGIAGE